MLMVSSPGRRAFVVEELVAFVTFEFWQSLHICPRLDTACCKPVYGISLLLLFFCSLRKEVHCRAFCVCVLWLLFCFVDVRVFVAGYGRRYFHGVGDCRGQRERGTLSCCKVGPSCKAKEHPRRRPQSLCPHVKARTAPEVRGRDCRFYLDCDKGVGWV